MRPSVANPKKIRQFFTAWVYLVFYTGNLGVPTKVKSNRPLV